MKIILETERLILKYQEAKDIEPLLELWTNPETTRFMGGPRNPENLRPLLEETTGNPEAEEFDLWPVVEKVSGEFAGHCGLLEKEVEGRKEIEVVYMTAMGKQHRGYAPEAASALIAYAFAHTACSRVIALIDPGNIPSERVAEKIGMHYEKTITRAGGVLRKLYVRSRKTAWG